MFCKSVSSLYVILSDQFVTIWHKDNKLIFCISTLTHFMLKTGYNPAVLTTVTGGSVADGSVCLKITEMGFFSSLNINFQLSRLSEAVGKFW